VVETDRGSRRQERAMDKQVSRFLGGSVCAVAIAVILAAVAAAIPAQAAARSKTPRLAAPGAATTTFNFSNIPVRSALQLIAEEGHFGLVVSDSVQGTISLHLADVTWEQALEIVLRLKGLEQRISGNTRSVTAAGG
jgi:type IV pilus assembly protein PilQ